MAKNARKKSRERLIEDYVDNKELARTHYNLGLGKGDKADFEGAIQEFDAAIELNPKLTQAYYLRAVAKSILEDFTGAIADCTMVITLDPINIDAYFTRGRVKELLGDLNGAKKDLRTAKNFQIARDKYVN